MIHAINWRTLGTFTFSGGAVKFRGGNAQLKSRLSNLNPVPCLPYVKVPCAQASECVQADCSIELTGGQVCCMCAGSEQRSHAHRGSD